MSFPVYFTSVRKNVYIYIDHVDRNAERIDKFSVGPIYQESMTVLDVLNSINMMWGWNINPRDVKIEQSKFVIGALDVTRSSAERTSCTHP